MRTFIAGLLAVGTMVILSACGGSSNSKLSYSAFSTAANKICASANAQAKTIEKGSSAKATAANAAIFAKLITINNKVLSSLNALSGPSALTADRDKYTALLKTDSDIAAQVEAAAKSGDQASYITEANKLGATSGESDALGSKLGAPACATDA